MILKNYIWNARPDVQDVCKSITSPSFNSWYETHGRMEHGLQDLNQDDNLPIESIKAINYKNRPFGVNLIGYESSTLGIGEDLRTCKEALQSAGVRCDR